MSKTIRISDKEAVKAIHDFLHHVADIDDVAEIYSRYCVDGPVVVTHAGEEPSDVYENGVQGGDQGEAFFNDNGE